MKPLICILALTLMTAEVCAEPLPAPGRMAERIFCADAPDHSYALYLPSGYSTDRKWPILYAFDAEARGALPVRRFRDAAEALGYIVAGSNNSRNGPWEPVLAAVDALWQDTHARLSIDDRQVYTAGFSGGARVASEVGLIHSNEVAGVIGCSGTFPVRHMPDSSLPFAFFATAGTTDFNLGEIEAVDSLLEDLDVPHHSEVFDGGHAWPPDGVCRRALEWMTLRAMRSGLRSLDRRLVEDVYRRRWTEAGKQEALGDLYEAHRTLRALAADMDGLRDMDDAGDKTRRLAMLPSLRKEIARRQEAERRREIVAKRYRALRAEIAEALKDPARRAGALTELKLQAGEEADSVDVRVAQRVLREVFIADHAKGIHALQSGDVDRALHHLETALAARDDDPSLLYNLACAYARGEGRGEEALETLARAVSNGFHDADHMLSDPDLAALRDDETFIRLVERARSSSHSASR